MLGLDAFINFINPPRFGESFNAVAWFGDDREDGAKTLQNCIASVAGVTERMVIADTGSGDGSSQLARDLGAEVFDIPWLDDFAQARNAAVRALSTDWVLIMDDDEELDPEARAKIPLLLEKCQRRRLSGDAEKPYSVKFGLGGHAASIKSSDSPVPGAERARAYAEFAICRLFRRRPEIYYVGRVHEHVEPSIHALGLKLAPADFVIHHFGHLCSPAELRTKDEFYRRLGRLKSKILPMIRSLGRAGTAGIRAVQKLFGRD